MIIHGECIKEMNRLIDEGVKVDMICCDPPFGTTQHPDDIIIPFDELWDCYNRIIKDDGAIILFAHGLFYVDLVNSNRENFRYDLVWDKVLPSGFLNSNRMPLRSHEQIAVFYKKLPTYNPQLVKGAVLHSRGKKADTDGIVKTNQNYGEFKYVPSRTDGMKFPNSILTYSKPHASVAKHRTEKSIPLLEWLVKSYTNEGELVLDNCAGSGTTAIACLNTKRKFIAIEKNEEYYNVIQERVAQRKRDLKSESYRRPLV